MQIVSLTAKVGAVICSQVPELGSRFSLNDWSSSSGDGEKLSRSLLSMIITAADQSEAVAWTYFHNGVV